MKFLKYVLGLAIVAVLTACGGGGGSGSGSGSAAPVTPISTANASVDKITINSSATVLNADGTSFVTLTIYALTSGNASVSGATIDLAATNGVVLSKSSVVTTATGATVTMVAASSDQTSRTSTITASCLSCTATPNSTQVSVVGATIALNNSGVSALVVSGSSGVLTATVKDAFGVPMQGVTVSFAATDPNILGLTVPSGPTNSSGVATVGVSGLAAGSASVNVTALGNAKAQAYTTGVATSVLAITSPANNTVVKTAQSNSIVVSAPGATKVTFATTLGLFGNGLQSEVVQVPVGGSVATAILTSSQAGTSSVTVIDDKSRSSTLTLIVSPPVSAVNKLLLNASQTTLPVASASGGSTSLTLTVRAILFDGVTDQSVANVPIEFSMTGGPGAGEFLSPALAYTNSAGYAIATFTAGTAASIPNGVVVSAKVQGTAIQTGTAPSNSSAKLTIGGQALSVAFGPASVLGESSDKTLYIQAYSVQITDANNNPVPNQAVTLRMRPVAFSIGPACTPTATYCSEDWNGNGSLEGSSEDGVRIPTTAATAGSCPSTSTNVLAATGFNLGTLDQILTPPNSDGGSVPSTVTTDSNGIAGFNLTYLKGSALWVVDKLTATVSSNGSETSKSTIFRLPASVPDTTAPCALPASPYSY